MLAPYIVLGLSPSATSDEIRRRYLELVRAQRPGDDPERFQQITAAYEALKDDRARVKTALFGTAGYGDFELALDALVKGSSGSPHDARLADPPRGGREAA